MTAPDPAARRGFWPLRDIPVVLWLVGAVVIAVLHGAVPAPRWLLIHLLLLGAATHSIFVWSRHFAEALLHTRPGDRRVQSARLLILNVGVLLVLVGVVQGEEPVVIAGASGVAAAVLWHGAALVVAIRRALPGRFRSTARYYVAAACFLPVGALLGALLARGLPGDWQDRTVLAHATINLLGWIGLPVVGTLVTLWPTMLRTRIADDAERSARRALPVLVAAIVVAAGAALLGWHVVAALGLTGYVAGLGLVAHSFADTARRRAPAAFPTWSVAAGLTWLVGLLAATAVLVGTAPSWAAAGSRLDLLASLFAVGFGAQVLLGALSYLIPMALGGGAVPVRAATAVFERAGALRIAVVNAGLLVCALPVPGSVRTACGALVLAGLGAFLPLLALAPRAARKARSAAEDAGGGPAAPVPGAPVRVTGPVAAGLAAVVVAVAAGVAADPSALAAVSSAASGAPGSARVVATGHTTTVHVEARDMRFSPDSIDVPAGDRLVVDVANRDDIVHDLVFQTGAGSPRLAPGGSARIDVGVVRGDLEGWCSVPGHRQMGMVLHVRALGGTTAAAPASSMPGMNVSGDSAADARIDWTKKPGAGFVAHDPTLPPLTADPVHRVTLTVSEMEQEIAPGVRQKRWTYGGSAPGPVLHGRVGDVFEVTLVNDGTIGHSIDFHAGSLAPDGPMRTIPPGQSLVYRFTAGHAGVWLYHCSSMPMSAHIASGMFGAVVIEPPGLAPADRSYVLVQSELYLGPQGGTLDVDKVNAQQPDAVVFNGYADQYDARPLPATVGERVRIWVVDAGPNRSSSFHVVGGQFDTVYAEGAYLLQPGAGGAQTLALAPGQGGFVELTFPQAGHYPFVTHEMVDAEHGAHGLFDVTG